jgi:hypothetical protein
MKGSFGVTKTVLHPVVPLKKYVENNDCSSRSFESNSVIAGPVDLHCHRFLETHQ